MCGEAEVFKESSINMRNLGTFHQFRVGNAHPAGTACLVVAVDVVLCYVVQLVVHALIP